ncbi:MAG: GDSL-type esterase/lipase family protein, partial [Plesiomonas sp.]
ALGANDGLRGQPLDRLENALSEIITRSQAQQATPILMQIQIPPNYGSRYSQTFSAIYPRLAEHFAVPLLPFFMENVISKPEWLMADGLHPNSTAQSFIAQMLYTQLLPILNSSPKP